MNAAANNVQRVVQYCSSLGRACGIATYTHMLSAAQKYRTVSTIAELEHLLPLPTHVHVQHEFGIMPLRELRAIHAFCQRTGALLCVTMHSVIPLPSAASYVRFRLAQKRGRLHPAPAARWVWTPEFPDYDAGSFVRFRRVQQFLIAHTDLLIVHCMEAKDALQEMGARRVEIIDHALERHRTSDRLHSEKDGKLHVGCFGFLKPHKSILELMDAIERIPDAILHLYASTAHNDEQSAYVRRVREKADAIGRVDIDTSHLPLDTIIYQLSKCDVNAWYCTPPGALSTSGSIRQYLAAERPIVASDNVMVSDIGHLVHRVPFGDITALVKALEHCRSEVEGIRAYNASHEWTSARQPYQANTLS